MFGDIHFALLWFDFVSNKTGCVPRNAARLPVLQKQSGQCGRFLLRLRSRLQARTTHIRTAARDFKTARWQSLAEPQSQTNTKIHIRPPFKKIKVFPQVFPLNDGGGN